LSCDLAEDNADLVTIFELGLTEELNELLGGRQQLFAAIILDERAPATSRARACEVTSA
jgi:hypothetical protein